MDDVAQRGGDWRVQQERFARAEALAAQREHKARERQRAADEREGTRRYKEQRAAEAAAETTALEERVRELSEVLVRGVASSGPRRFEDAIGLSEPEPLNLGRDDRPLPQPVWEEPPGPGFWSALTGGRRRFERDRDDAYSLFQKALAEAQMAESARQTRVARRRREHAAIQREAAAQVERRRRDAKDLDAAVERREPEAVQPLAELVLERIPLPEDFPQRYEVLASPDGSHVVVRWQLPPVSVVPEHRAVHYLSSKDEKRALPRPQKGAAAVYRSVVAQVAVLVVRSVLISDRLLARVTFSGHVDSVDPATGADSYPCLLSVAVDRETLPEDANLMRDGFDPEACVIALGALVSQHPYAREPVEPFLDFDLTRFAFVEGLDAVSSLDSRPNLLEVSPSMFEHLVRQVLMQQGDEGWTTTESNDSGIDAVLVNRSKVMGGLSVVQAKRYKPGSKIGPAHIRELAGAMEEKKAGWGILVTTSSFTAGSEQKAREHGRMQLISGEQLCWLIKERTGKDVLIG